MDVYVNPNTQRGGSVGTPGLLLKVNSLFSRERCVDPNLGYGAHDYIFTFVLCWSVEK